MSDDDKTRKNDAAADCDAEEIPRQRQAIEKVPGLVWTPIRTKPRQEKKLHAYAESHSLEMYLPLRVSRKRYQRRTVEFLVPMFPGYVFAPLDEDIYQTLLLCGAIAFKMSMTEISEQGLIRDLNALLDFERMAAEKEVVIKPEVVEGAYVTVSSGPLQGVSGIVERRGKETMLTVNVEILGQSVSAKIDIEDVELEEK
jgi:transcription antitermination factor NusG